MLSPGDLFEGYVVDAIVGHGNYPIVAETPLMDEYLERDNQKPGE